MMYLKVKDLTPCKHESIYEIAYLLLGRPAIFTVCIVQYLLNFSSMVLYYIIIGDTIGNIFSHFFVNKDALKTRGEAQQDLKSESVWTQIVSHRSFWILTVGAVLLSIIFMRQLRELKVISYIFMMIMLLFLGLLSLELHVGGGDLTMTYEDVTRVNFDHHLITAFSIVVFAYNIQFLVFPAYIELSDRSNFRFAQASIISILIETFMYMGIGLVAVVMFGPDNLKPDMLENMAMREGSLSLVIRGIFSLLLIFDVPFIFFATKEQSLVLHDELVNKSLSRLTE